MISESQIRYDADADYRRQIASSRYALPADTARPVPPRQVPAAVTAEPAGGPRR